MREQLIQYVELLFAGAPDSDDIKQEILQNTLDRYDDLIAEGKVPQAAYRLAIAGIGDVNEILGTKPQRTPAPTPKAPEIEDGDDPRKKLVRAIAIGLYILCPIPLIGLSGLSMDILGLCLTLVIVAAATVLMVLGAKKEDDEDEPNLTPLQKSVRAVIWAIGIGAYILISFTTYAWHVSWVILLLTGAVQSLAMTLLGQNGPLPTRAEQEVARKSESIRKQSPSLKKWLLLGGIVLLLLVLLTGLFEMIEEARHPQETTPLTEPVLAATKQHEIETADWMNSDVTVPVTVVTPTIESSVPETRPVNAATTEPVVPGEPVVVDLPPQSVDWDVEIPKVVLRDVAGRVSAGSVQELNIEWAAGNILILPVAGIDEITFGEITDDSGSKPLHYSIDGYELTIQFQKNPLGGYSADSAKDLVIQVPEAWMCQSVEIDGALINVQIWDLLAREVDLNTTTGTVEFYDTYIGKLDVDTASSNVIYKGQLEALDFDGASAEFIGWFTTAPKTIDVDGMAGKLDIILPGDSGFNVQKGSLSGSFATDFPYSSRGGLYTGGDESCRITADAMTLDLVIRQG